MQIRIFLSCLVAALSAPAVAQPRTAERPEVLSRVTACRTVTDDAQRLACFDRQVAALEAAEAAREISVVDRQQVRRARRSLFGLRLPDLGIFGDDDDNPEDGAAINEINSTIRSFTTGYDGRRVFVLADGSVWAQTDGRSGPAPRTGQAIRIRRGPLGSFIANIEGRAGLRVIRQR